MGQLEIIEKLRTEIEKNIEGEPQVVYILSRIRKYLELKNQKSKYKYLNFYCNWALHAKLDRTESISKILQEITIGGEEGLKLITFKHLQVDLKKFFNDNSITEDILDKQWLQFSNLLLDIYSDTPLEFYPGNKRVLKIRKPEKPPKTGEFSVAFDIV